MTQAKASPIPMARYSVSPSKLRTFGCPYRYMKKYIKRTEEPQVLPFAMGSLTHDIAAEYFSACASSGLTSNDRLYRITDDCWFKRDPLIEADSWDDVDMFVRTLAEYPIDPKAIVGVEQKLSLREDLTVTAWDTTDVAYGGIMDLVTAEGSGYQIVDWTTAALGGVHQRQKEFQLRFYGWLFYTYLGLTAENNRRNEIAVRTKSLRTGKEIEVQLTPDDHAKTWSRIEIERRRIMERVDNDGPWEACAGSLCAICHLDCPLEKIEGAPPVRIDDAKSAGEVHQRLILVDRERKLLTSLLKSYVGVHGSVESNGVEARIDSTEKHNYDVPGIIECLSASGWNERDIHAVLSVNRTKLKKACNKDEATWIACEAEDDPSFSERFTPIGTVKEA